MKRRDALKNTLVGIGSAAAVPSLLSLLQSCESTPRVSWQPKFLDNEQALFITQIVDAWLPATETPGALDVKVDIFIDLVFAELFDADAQKMVSEQIGSLNTECQEQFSNSFIDLSSEEKEEYMMMNEKRSGKFNSSVWGTAVGEQQDVSFYLTLKSMALWGYFTSEEIGKNHLNYDPIPGEYRGCIPLSEVGNAWSLG